MLRFQQNFHKLINKHNNKNKAKNQENTTHLNIDFLYGFFPQKEEGELEPMLFIGYSNNFFMDETYFGINLIKSIPKLSNIKAAFEASLMLQHKGTAFQNEIRNSRFEISLAAMVKEYYKPSFKYISPYIKGDNYGQIYIDLLNYHINF